MNALVPVAPEQLAAWNEVVEASPHATPFHIWEWLDFLERYQEVRVLRLGLYEKRRLTAVFPLAIGYRWGLRMGGSPLYIHGTPYLGPLSAGGPLTPHLWNCIRTYLRSRFLPFVRMFLPPSVDSHQLSLPSGFRIVQRHTHVMDLLQSNTELWANLNRNRHRNIRNAEKSGVRVEIIMSDFSEQSLDLYRELLRTLYTRQNLPVPYPDVFYRDITRVAPTNLPVYLALAFVNNALVAATLGVSFKGTYYDLDAVRDPAFDHTSAKSLLQWRHIERAKTDGLRRYDFVGSNIPSHAQHKASFGGTLTTYACVEFARPAAVFGVRDAFGRYRYSIRGAVRRLSGSFRPSPQQ